MENRRTDQAKVDHIKGYYARNLCYQTNRNSRAYVEELAGIEGMRDSGIELGRTSSEEQIKSQKNTGEAHVASQTFHESHRNE